jgi:EpsI family protein
MVTRILITSALLLAGAGYIGYEREAETLPDRPALTTLPMQLERWRGRNDPPFNDELLAELGVDEYLMRSYLAPSEPMVSLYVGFYASQRQGDTIHSPLNCLPGAGWLPMRQGRASFDVTTANTRAQSITVNEVIIQKGLDRHLVLYWYQSHGRVVASEYTSKLYMVADAIRLNRTDASLVRVITPITGETAADEAAASRRVQEFAKGIFPSLSRVIPS